MFVVLHHLLSGRFWLWLLPDLVPPVVYLVIPLVLLVPIVVTVVRPAAARPGGGRFRWGYGATVAAALVLGAGQGGLNLGGPSGDGGPVPPGALRVVSWNTEYWTQGEQPERFYAYLRSLRADVYVLQEYIHWEDGGPRSIDELFSMRREFPGFHIAVQGELVTLSRFPIVAAPKVGPAATLRPASPWRSVYDLAKVLRTDLRVGASVLSVYNVHIPAQYKVGDNPFTSRFYADLRGRDALRRAQYRGLGADVGANGNPLLVAGDFNTTAAMGDLRGLPSRLTDAGRAAASLYPASWPAGGPALWRLDWAFTAGPNVHGYAFLDPQGMSDHRVQELLMSIESPRS
ncbi:endonuclease/exonuclease/phosphatase family protein [Sphaerisporangium corydalis]|uniref:Endonuclease/exonuclease/phosphatase family protein n=1 Tax=Sphaerisporangium corydalis TaxID=1441875 RepID=A0ABV9EDM0_9ACTN|nr:endonuclease/exonuclease/phosphatase family protein [Sphaerisporangium corydalis]